MNRFQNICKAFSQILCTVLHLDEIKKLLRYKKLSILTEHDISFSFLFLYHSFLTSKSILVFLPVSCFYYTLSFFISQSITSEQCLKKPETMTVSGS